MKDDVALSILQVKENGKKMKDEFITSRINSNQTKFHDPLKRNNVKTFKTLTTHKVKCKSIQGTVEVNRNILSSLLAFSIKKERIIDLLAALAYPLSPVP